MDVVVANVPSAHGKHNRELDNNEQLLQFTDVFHFLELLDLKSLSLELLLLQPIVDLTFKTP